MVKLWECTPLPKTNMDPKSRGFLNLGISFQPIRHVHFQEMLLKRSPGTEKTDQTPIYWVTDLVLGENEAFYLLHRYGYQPIHSWWFWVTHLKKKCWVKLGIMSCKTSFLASENPMFWRVSTISSFCFADLRLFWFEVGSIFTWKVASQRMGISDISIQQGHSRFCFLPPSFGHPESP